MPSTTTLALRAGLVAALALTSSASELEGRQMVTTTCADVHIFLAKGNNEPYPGRQGKLVTAICDGLSSCDYEDIQMANMLADAYCGSVYEGATNGYAQITAYNLRCPDAKLVVSGYSQGAHVVGDFLGGGGGTFFDGCVEASTPNLDASVAPGNMIAAILTFGDTRHTANQPYNYQTGAGDAGLFPRSAAMMANLDTYSAVYRDYCVSTDPICAGGEDGNTHLAYFDDFTDEAAAWVQGKVGGTTTGTSTGDTAGVISTTQATATTVRQVSTSATGTVTTKASITGGVTTSTPLPEATASTTANLSATPTTSTSPTTSSSATSAQDQLSSFGLAIAAAFAFLLF